MHSVRPPVSITLLLFAAVSFADTRSVITERYMPTTPERVIQSFVDGDDLAAWWLVTRSLVEPVEGGVWSIAWDDYGEEKTHHSWSGVVREISPTRLVIGQMVMIEPDMPLLGPMQLTIAAVPDGGGSMLTVTHSGYGYGDHWDEMYDLVVNGWDHVLTDLGNWFRDYD